MDDHPPSLLALLEEIRAIARTGLAYSTDPFERERYERLYMLALNEYADLTDLPQAPAGTCHRRAHPAASAIMSRPASRDR